MKSTKLRPVDHFSDIFTSWAKLRILKISFFVFVFSLIALLKSSVFNVFDHIPSQNQIWYDNLLIWNFIRFPDFPPIFSGLSSNLQISMLLTIFLHRIDGLIIKYDTIAIFFVTLSSICIFSCISMYFSDFCCIFLQILTSLFEIKVDSSHEVGL